jgi:hypothetical protein
MASGVISSKDGVARPPIELHAKIVNAKRERLKRHVRVQRVRMASVPRHRKGSGVLLLPGEEEPRDQALLAKLKSGIHGHSTTTERVASQWVYNTFLKRWWAQQKAALPTSTSPIGRLRRSIPVWKRLFPAAAWNHDIIKDGFSIACPGYLGQASCPAPLTKSPSRDVIWTDLEAELEVGVLKVMTPSNRPDLFDGRTPRVCSNLNTCRCLAAGDAAIFHRSCLAW